MSSKVATLDTLKGLGNNLLGLFDKNRTMVNLADTKRDSTEYKYADQNQKNEFNARSSALMS
jgi:hypothetical protein